MLDTITKHWSTNAGMTISKKALQSWEETVTVSHWKEVETPSWMQPWKWHMHATAGTIKNQYRINYRRNDKKQKRKLWKWGMKDIRLRAPFKQQTGGLLFLCCKNKMKFIRSILVIKVKNKIPVVTHVCVGTTTVKWIDRFKIRSYIQCNSQPVEQELETGRKQATLNPGMMKCEME